MTRSEALFSAFQNQRVLVVGDAMLDAYMWGKIERTSPEAPVPIVDITRREVRLGGAANVALNVKALGGEPVLCALLGNDHYASAFLEEMEKAQLETSGVLKVAHHPTTVKTRIIAENKHVLRVDEEDTGSWMNPRDLSNHIIDQMIANKPDLLIFEDYDKGMLCGDCISDVMDFAREHGIPVAVDPKYKNFKLYRGADLFKPNLRELKDGVTQHELHPDHPETLRAAVDGLAEEMGLQRVLLTLSEHGMGLWNRESAEWLREPAHKREITDVSGAGDTSITAAAMALAAGASDHELLALANLAGGLVCEYPGVVPIDAQRLKNGFNQWLEAHADA